MKKSVLIYQVAIACITLALIMHMERAHAQPSTSKKEATSEGRQNESTSLLQACAALKSASRRAECFEAVAKTAILARDITPAVSKPTSLNPHDSAKTEELSRQKKSLEQIQQKYSRLITAFAALKAASSTGVSYTNYQPLVLGAATEIEVIRRGSPAPREEEGLLHFATAVEAYADAARLWQANIKFFADRRNHDYVALPYNKIGLGLLVGRYGIPSQDAQIFGNEQGVKIEPALRYIWERAEAEVHRAEASIFVPLEATLATGSSTKLPVDLTFGTWVREQEVIGRDTVSTLTLGATYMIPGPDGRDVRGAIRISQLNGGPRSIEIVVPGIPMDCGSGRCHITMRTDEESPVILEAAKKSGSEDIVKPLDDKYVWGQLTRGKKFTFDLKSSRANIELVFESPGISSAQAAAN